MIRTKFDYPPLLGPGRHIVDREALWDLFVVERGAHRVDLHFSLAKLLDELDKHGFPCEVWVDGSFVCTKEMPEDVDVVIVVWHEVFDKLPIDVQDFLLGLMVPEEKFDGCVDAWACIEYPSDHPNFENDNPLEYVELYGKEHSGEWLKGFAVVRLGAP